MNLAGSQSRNLLQHSSNSRTPSVSANHTPFLRPVASAPRRPLRWLTPSNVQLSNTSTTAAYTAGKNQDALEDLLTPNANVDKDLNLEDLVVEPEVQTFSLTSDPRYSTEAIAGAAMAAEAEQQALMTSGVLAEHMQHNELLSRILNTYSTVQQLYHKAALAQLQQHAQLASSPAGLAYSVYCDLLGLQPTKAPDTEDDTISSAELQNLQQEVEQLPAASMKLQQACLAYAISKFAQAWPDMTSVELFVMPDIITMLSCGWTQPPDVSEEAVGTVFAWAEVLPHNSSNHKDFEAAYIDIAEIKLVMQQCLLGVCQPSNIPSNFPPSALIVVPDARQLLLVDCITSVIDAALSTLQNASDICMVARATAEHRTWPMLVHSNPMKTSDFCRPVGTMPAWLTFYCMFVSLSAALHDTAMEQLLGIRPRADWMPSLEVLSFVTECLAGWQIVGGWASAEKRLLELYDTVLDSRWKCPWHKEELFTFLRKIMRQSAIGGLLPLSGNAAWQECSRLLNYPNKQRLKSLVSQPAYIADAMGMQSVYMSMELTRMHEIVDIKFGCWCYSWYWQDIVDVALKAAGGQPGPAAAAAAEQLLKEPHSIFVARYALRWADLAAPSYPDRVVTNSLICRAPFQLDSDLHHAVIARGDTNAAAQVAAFSRSGNSTASNVPPAVHAKASTMFAVAPKSCTHQAKPLMLTQSPLAQQITTLLLGKPSTAQTATEQVSTIICAACGVSEVEGSVEHAIGIDPALSSTLAAWLQQIKMMRCAESTKAASPQRLAWMPVALAQWRILQLASSPEFKQQLSVTGAVPQAYLRPIAEYASLRSDGAAALVQQVCEASWSIHSSTAEGVVLSQVMTLAPTSKLKVHGLMWLSAAVAAALEDEAAATELAFEDLTAAMRSYFVAGGQQAMSDMQLEFHAYMAFDMIIGKQTLPTAYNLLRSVLEQQPFAEQAPVLQAMIQATMGRLIMRASDWGWDASLVDLIQQAPLMQADDYTCALDLVMKTGSVPWTAKAWQAAVSTATDPVLSALPAFGRQRPDEAWLAQELLRILPSLEDDIEMQLAILKPAYKAALAVIQQQGSSARSDSTNRSAQPAGQLLLHSICAALPILYDSCINPVTILQPLVLGVLDLLLHHTQISTPPASTFKRMLSVAAGHAAAEGDVAVYSTAVQHAQQLQLSDDDIMHIRSVMLIWADAHCSVGNVVIKQLWSEILAGGNTSQQYGLHDAAEALVYCIINPSMAAQLLDGSVIPVPVLTQLCEAAVSTNTVPAMVSLLHHADQHQMLQQLPAGVLSAVWQPTSIDINSSKALKWSTLAALLQQEQVQLIPAELVLQAASISGQQWGGFLGWLHDKCTKAPAAAAHLFLCSLLQASAVQQQPDQTWQLFEVLQACLRSCGWPEAKQLLPAAVCSALIEQQAATGCTESSTNKVVQLWEAFTICSEQNQQHKSPSRSSALTLAAQKAVVSALVATGQHTVALQLVHANPLLLQHLSFNWQQLQEGSVPAELIKQAVNLASCFQSSAAASAAEKLLSLIAQQQGSICQALQDESAVRLAQLLSQHDRLAAAQRILTECIVGKLSATATAPAIAAFIKAAACWSSPQDLVSQLFSQSTVQQQQAVLLAALDVLLAEDDPPAAAVSLAVHTLQASIATAAATEPPPLPDLLTDAQLGQLVQLSCTVAHNGTSSNSALHLPSPSHLAQQCVSSSKAVPASVTVSLINALAHKQPDLQPSRAAVVLGLVSEHDLAAVEGRHESSSKHKMNDHQTDNTAPDDEVLIHILLIAQLCYQQLCSSAKDLENSVPGWVSGLSAEAAAAALFSAWYWAQPSAQTAAAATGRAMHLTSVPSATAIGMLCLGLYDAARAGDKPSLSSLLMDLALLAAPQARQWETGLNVVNKAQRVLESTAGSRASNTPSKRSGNKQQHHHLWVPVLPAAVAALPAVLVYGQQQQGVDKMAEVLLQEYEELVEQQMNVTPAAGRRKQQAHKQSASHADQRGTQLLVLPVLNSFFTATLDVEQAAHADHDKNAVKAAAAAACKVADTVFATQMMSVQLAARSTSPSSVSGGFSLLPQQQQPVMPDAVTYCTLCQLYAAAGQFSKAASITLAAVKQQLPLPNSRSANRSVETLQTVVAGATAVWQAADCPGIVTALLDLLICAGVEEIADPLLAAALEEAAQTYEEKVVSRLAHGEEGLFELMELAEQSQAAEAMVPGWQCRPVQLACSEALNGEQLVKELHTSLWKAAARLDNKQ